MQIISECECIYEKEYISTFVSNHHVMSELNRVPRAEFTFCICLHQNILSHLINAYYHWYLCVSVCADFVSSSWAPTAGFQTCPTRPSCTPSKPSALRWSKKRRLRPWPSARWSVRNSRGNWRYSSRKNQKENLFDFTAVYSITVNF